MEKSKCCEAEKTLEFRGLPREAGWCSKCGTHWEPKEETPQK